MLRKNFIDAFVSKRPLLAVLTGPAGSGKSHTIKTIVSKINPRPVVLAPTNAACKRLKDDGVHAITVMSYLKGRPDLNIKATTLDAAEQFIYGTPDDVEIVIVDEYSMATDIEVKMIMESCQSLLLVGDAAQLPPVGGKPFDPHETELAYELTRVFRATCPQLKERIYNVRKSGTVESDGTIEDVAQAFLDDEEEDKIFLAKANKDIERMAALLPEPNAFLGYRGFTFWRSDEEDITIMNGDTITPKTINGTYHEYMPNNRSSHTKFKEHPLANDPRYFICNCEEIEDDHFIHCWRGTDSMFKREVLDDAYQQFRGLVMVILDKLGLTEDEAWSANVPVLKNLYAQWKMLTNTFVCENSKVSTIHKAQGRGFRHVYLFDHKLSRQERYVGTSRAKDTLTVGTLL